MAGVNGIGAVMIYASDPATLSDWYAKVLRIETSLNHSDGCYYGQIEDARTGAVVHFGIYPAKNELPPRARALMVNYRVDEFDEFVEELNRNGVSLQDKVLVDACGRFAYISDPEGNPIEIWTDK